MRAGACMQAVRAITWEQFLAITVWGGGIDTCCCSPCCSKKEARVIDSVHG